MNWQVLPADHRLVERANYRANYSANPESHFPQGRPGVLNLPDNTSSVWHWRHSYGHKWGNEYQP
jgi:hypothetical protein